MNTFSGSSTKRLFDLHTNLALLCGDVLAHYDISILCTTRTKKEQEKAFDNGYSSAHFGNSPHNYDKALAVDVGLWSSEYGGIDYNDIDSFRKIMDCFKLHAEARGIEITCGYDWNEKDMPHIELVNWRELSIDTALVD